MDAEVLIAQSLTALDGVGPSRAQLLNKLGLFSINDVLNHFPRNYEDRSRMCNISELQHGVETSFEGIVVSGVKVSSIRKGLKIYKLLIKDGTGTITATWFNQPFIKKTFIVGESYVFFGKIKKNRTITEIVNPVYEKLDVSSKKHIGRIIPIYPSTSDLSQTILRGIMESAVQAIDGKLPEHLPHDIRLKHVLCEINYAYKNIHFPSNADSFLTARRRLVFDELLLMQLALWRLKHHSKNKVKGICFKDCPIQVFIESLPFSLTNAQIRVFKEIEADMEKELPMSRLVQGDVGSGKTVLAAMAIYKAVFSGYQATMMAPTQILAEQHYVTLSELLKPHGINVGLLTASITGKSKQEIKSGAQNGDLDVLIGTHALLQQDVVFDNLGLVITDEQHRFGVRQRAALLQKALECTPDVLVMTATPIPRTLALILYGDLDISIIDEMPVGRKKIQTYVVDDSMRPRIENFIRKQVAEGGQVYIVCPVIEQSEEEEPLKSAIEYARRLKQEVFPGLNIGLLHGKMSPKDKDCVMGQFKEGKIDILVSTTVIEVGVNVSNATLMIIEEAQNFGLSQLHQLRGRVGRGEAQSYCVLFNNGKSKDSILRIKILEKTNDGFIIADKDMELRGTGEFFGTRQHGVPELKIANLYTDTEILRLVQQVAAEILQQDPLMEMPQNNKLKNVIKKTFSADYELMN